MRDEPVLEHRVVSQAEMDAWPVDRARSGEKRWAETTWGTGPLEGPNRLLYNWNTWPCRVALEVTQESAKSQVVRGEAVWRRSSLSIRMKGLKLVSAADPAKEITDARMVRFDQERVVVDFRPTTGAGLYFLYYGAAEEPLFAPSEVWLRQANAGVPATAAALRNEARCKLDCFAPMETIALPGEVDALRALHPSRQFMVFPEDRDRPIKLHLEIPAHWALQGPAEQLTLQADRHEYRVFQLGVWACGASIGDVTITPSDLRGPDGATISAAAVQCLTLESRIQSRFITKPQGPCAIPQGQVRALWFGIDISDSAVAGTYSGTVTVQPKGQQPCEVALRLVVSDHVVPERGDHDLHRLSRLRWLESDVGISDKVYPPFQPLRVADDGRRITTWGHTLSLARTGLPEGLSFGDEPILATPIELAGRVGGRPLKWRGGGLTITQKSEGAVEWQGEARSGDVALRVTGRIEYDGCALIDLALDGPKRRSLRVDDLTLTLRWRKEHAELASGMGYRGRREGDRLWRHTPRGARCFDPSLWLGSVKAGLGWATWLTERGTIAPPAGGLEGASGGDVESGWEDIARPDAATVTEEADAVQLRLNLGGHTLGGGKSWSMRFALLPTPVKPYDARHWQFRYMHKGGGFWPSDTDTPQSFLKDNCRRLDHVVNELGVTRLNLHDWWGPAFNYPWQWDGPDNLARLTAEAHKRGIFTKVYNSGRELSALAPEFWAMVFVGTQFKFPETINPDQRLYHQDAWHLHHMPDGIPVGWPRLHKDHGNEHTVPVSNATRNGNFYLESMKYMTRFFGTDGAYWDGADGPTFGHREMAKRLYVIFREHNPDACIDVHHGDSLVDSPISRHMLCFPFIDSLWHGEGFEYGTFDPWTWLTEISGLPFNVPSEMLGGDAYLGRGMLFGIWPRHGWYAETDKPAKLWKFFDRFGIEQAKMLGFWEKPPSGGGNGVILDRPDTYATAFAHPSNGVLLVIATWHPPLAGWMEMTLDTSVLLSREHLELPAGALRATDIFSDEELDITKPVPLPDAKFGRLLWVRGA